MHDGVTVVAYSSQGLRLLKDCSVAGTYGFVQVAPKRQMIRLRSRDEVRANLPTSAGKMLSVNGDVGRDRGIEIAMTIVGKFRTTRHSVTFPMLRGACGGATHFVRGATVGAFAMKTNAGGWSGAGVQAFGAELGGAAEGQQAVENRDGDPTACGETDQKALLSGCGALIRLELGEVKNEGRAALPQEPPGDPASAALQNTCPLGFVSLKGKCTRPADNAPYTCSPDDLADCYRQCDAGDGRSCVIAGVRQRDQRGGAESGLETWELFERACAKEDALGCTLLGDMYRFGADVERDVLTAGAHYRMGCDAGVAAACRQLGTMFYYGDGLSADLTQAVSLYGRGCDAGDQRSCSLLGDLHMTSVGEFHNPVRAVELFQRACDGEDIAGCLAHVRAIEFGLGTKRDIPDAIAKKHRLCDRTPTLCGQLGINYLAGRGVNRNLDAARRLFTTSCSALEKDKGTESWGEPDLYAFYSCLIAERRFGNVRATDAQKEDMAARVQPVLKLISERCTQGAAFECFDGGYLLSLAGEEHGALELFHRGCEYGNEESCDTLKPEPVDPPAAAAASSAAADNSTHNPHASGNDGRSQQAASSDR